MTIAHFYNIHLSQKSKDACFCHVFAPTYVEFYIFVSKQQLDDAIGLLDDYKTGKVPEGTTDDQLWKAQKIKQVLYLLHPLILHNIIQYIH